MLLKDRKNTYQTAGAEHETGSADLKEEKNTLRFVKALIMLHKQPITAKITTL